MDKNIKKERFDCVLENAVDMQHVDPKRVDKWLADYTTRKRWVHSKLIRDYTLAYLKDHRYPDGKTIQVELVDMTILQQEEAKIFLKRLWSELLGHKHARSDKHLQVSDSSNSRRSSSSSSPSSSHSRHHSDDQRSKSGSSKYYSSHHTTSSSHRSASDFDRAESASSYRHHSSSHSSNRSSHHHHKPHHSTTSTSSDAPSIYSLRS